MRQALAGVCITVLAMAAQAQSAGQWRDSEQLWQATCAYCHAGVPGADVGPPLRGRDLPAPLVVHWARYGGKGMPAFLPSQVSDRELDQLALWLARKP
jgi:mono/diheme cytochrome c family protein